MGQLSLQPPVRWELRPPLEQLDRPPDRYDPHSEIPIILILMGPRAADQRQSGQAAVEAAITLPLAVFLILGTLQLFMMLQARIMAEHAVFKAVRTGVVKHGDCEAMRHAAILALLPSIHSYLKPGGGPPAQRLAQSFRARRDNRFVAGEDAGHDRAIVWMIRDSPDRGSVSRASEDDFDDTTTSTGGYRLTVRLVYWYPLKIPFANWVMARMFLAYTGVQSYQDKLDPLMVTKNAQWTQESPFPLETALRNELRSRVNASQYTWPIHASYSMRMMTPPRERFFTRKNCPDTPETL
jgi:hypothetical protein